MLTGSSYVLPNLLPAPPPNYPQEPTCGRSPARRFRGSNSATRGVAQPRAIRPHAAQRKNVRRTHGCHATAPQACLTDDVRTCHIEGYIIVALAMGVIKSCEFLSS